ncbi:MAG: pyridoxamine 5'-phosphate oxidase [Actinobacteria bacterium]|nr:pyridoxamine 5'-phosphate oxidase [Actinomycetota bacterium]
MGRLNEAAKDVLARMKVIPVATASGDGCPNVVPMTFVKALDDSTLLIADNYMDKGARNLEENPQVAVSVWDTETKQAYQIKGAAEVLRAGPVFDEAVTWVKGSKPHLTTKAAVVMKVAHLYVCQPGVDLGKDVA